MAYHCESNAALACFDLALQQIKYSGALTLLNANSDLHKKKPILVFWTREVLFLCCDSRAMEPEIAMEDPMAYPR